MNERIVLLQFVIFFRLFLLVADCKNNKPWLFLFLGIVKNIYIVFFLAQSFCRIFLCFHFLHFHILYKAIYTVRDTTMTTQLPVFLDARRTDDDQCYTKSFIQKGTHSLLENPIQKSHYYYYYYFDDYNFPLLMPPPPYKKSELKKRYLHWLKPNNVT